MCIRPACFFCSLLFRSRGCCANRSVAGCARSGTFSEYLWRTGRDTFKKNWRLPRVLDVCLRTLKYLLLGLFVYAIAGMPVDAIRAFLDGPYGLIADVKLLNFFRYLSIGGAITLALLVILSVFVQNFWCRYLCPYGALLGLFSLASPLRIRRSTTLCIDCGKCSRECPSLLPVDRLVTIRSAECTGCMQCVAACPVASALVMSAPGIRMVPAWAIGAVDCSCVLRTIWTGRVDRTLAYRVAPPRIYGAGAASPGIQAPVAVGGRTPRARLRSHCD